MDELTKEVRLLREARKIMEWWKVDYHAATMILFHMALTGCTYQEALNTWADYEDFGGGGHWPPERWHSEICYKLIWAWVIEPPAQWFDCRAQEVRDNADRVHA